MEANAVRQAQMYPDPVRIEKLTAGLGKVRARLVRDVSTGILRSGSLRLTHIAQELRESISLHATHKRLSRNLGDPCLGEHLQQRILELGTKNMDPDTRIILDCFDITKQYARKMEFIEQFESSADESLAGFHACEVIASDQSTFWPLDLAVWSSNLPDFLSEQELILDLVTRVRKATGERGILVVNAALGDTDGLLVPWANDPSNRFIVRLHDNRELEFAGKRLTSLKIFDCCERPYGKLVFKYDKLIEEQFFVDFGCVPVRLPGAEDRPLWLVCAMVEGGYKYLVLTSDPRVETREGLERVVRAYLTRVQVVSTLMVARKKTDFDDARVHSFRRLENLLRLYHAGLYSGFGTSHLPMIDAGITYDRRTMYSPG